MLKSMISKIRSRVNEVGNTLALKLLTCVLVTIVISIVLFRELFIIDTFYTVFFTMVLVPNVYKKVKRLFE